MNIIDIHTHGIGGFDTRSSTAEDILRIAEIHGALGVSEIVLSIYPAPIAAMRHQMELVTQAMEAQRRPKVKGPRSKIRGREPGASGMAPREEKELGPCHVSFQDAPLQCATLSLRDAPLPLSRVTGHGGVSAARILAVHLEGPFLNPAQCGALDPAPFFDPREHASYELVDGFEHMVKTITVAPERQGALAFIRNITELGIVVSLGHSDATYAEAEAGFRQGRAALPISSMPCEPFITESRDLQVLGY